MQEMWVRSLGQKEPLEKEMETHSSIRAWEIPQRNQVGHSPQDHKELDVMEVTEHTVRLFILSPLLFTSVIS